MKDSRVPGPAGSETFSPLIDSVLQVMRSFFAGILSTAANNHQLKRIEVGDRVQAPEGLMGVDK
jgi:hypothetical protein